MDTLNDLFALWREDYDLGVLMLAGGGMVGLLFGIFAERTDFCSRAALPVCLQAPGGRMAHHCFI